MRDTVRPSWRAIENPPAALAAAVDGGTVGLDGSAAGGAGGVTGGGSGVSTIGMIGSDGGIAVRCSSTGRGGGAGAGVGAGTTSVALLPALRSASITRRNGL